MAGRHFLAKVDYVPMKLHYFFFNAGLSAIIPFLSVYAKQLGISPFNVGVIFTILPFMSMLAKPMVGAIADRTKKLNLILHVLLCSISVSSLLMVFIPSKYNTNLSSFIRCSSNGTTFHYDNQPLPKCLTQIPVNEAFSCYFTCNECINITEFDVQGHCKSDEAFSGEMKVQLLQPDVNVFDVTEYIGGSRFNKTCSGNKNLSCSVTCNPALHKCYQLGNFSDAESIQFWLFFILVIFCYLPAGICNSLGDAVCFNLLGENAHLYGYQRLWGTIGWGIFGLIAGAINSAITGTSFIHAYYPGFSLTVILLLMDIVTIRNINTDNLVFSKSILRDVFKLLKKLNILMFLMSVFVVGLLTSFMWTFLFWHLVTLNATSLLLGGVSAVQCLLAELPFMYFSKNILRVVGHFNALTINFIAYGIRFLLYTYLKDPIWVLFIELLQGPSLGLFYSAFPSYANAAALPGTEATMQGLAGGAFEGLGLAVGSLLGGFVMQNYKGSTIFFYGSLIAFGYAIVNIFFTMVLYFKDRKAKKQRTGAAAADENPGEATVFLG